MDGHGIVRRRVLVPHPAVYLVGREHLPRMLHQKPQNVVFQGRQVHGVPVHGDGFGVVVQADPADGHGGGGRMAAAQGHIPPQLGPDPGQQLHGVEGLGHIVVGPHVQSQHLVRVLGLGRQQDHRQIVALPQAGHGGDAVHPRHHHVQQDQVHLLPVQQPQGLIAVIGRQHPVALGGQIDVQGRHDVLFIVADQDGVHGDRLSFLGLHRRQTAGQKGSSSSRPRPRRDAALTRCSMGFHSPLLNSAAKEMGI